MITLSREEMQVTYSKGRSIPTIKVPENACDSHHHIYDPTRFSYLPTDVRNQPPARVEEYRVLQKKLGLTRNVIVQPSAYGTDNSCTLDALIKMGDTARAVVVVDEAITQETLAEWEILGVRGVRLNIARGGIDNVKSIQNIADKILDFGWHLQFWMSADTTVALESFLKEVKNTVVFDHRGHLPKDQGIKHPAFKIISNLLTSGKGWVKLSGLYMDHDDNFANYEDTVAVGKAYVQINPNNLVWGTDWPNPIIFSNKLEWPNDTQMLDLLAEQAGSEENLHKILVENPVKLYRF